MPNRFKKSLFIFMNMVLLTPGLVWAEHVDLSISASSISFSEDTLYAGDTVRIYATIQNVGDIDSIAQVFFYQSDVLIGSSQPISVVANGDGDDVFVDYVLPEGSFNIRAVIQGANPVDSNASNDVAVTPLYKTISDEDYDGVLDSTDNCSEVSNENQADFDNDQLGDECDNDIDNDGTLNTDDDFPRDASLTEIVATPPIVSEVVVPQIAAVETVVAPTKDSQLELDAMPLLLIAPVSDKLAELAANTLDLSGLGAGSLSSSPAASFTYKQINWRTYEFIAQPPLGGANYVFKWTFGDEATSAQSTVKHTFPSAGTYVVTLTTQVTAGEAITDSQELVVSFFHLANPLLLGAILLLILTLISLVVLLARLRRGSRL